MTESRINLRLRTTIAGVLIGLLLLLSSFVIWSSARSQARSIRDAANALITATAEGVSGRYHQLLDPIYSFVRLSPELPDLLDGATIQLHPAAGLLLRLVDAYPQVSAAYFGHDNGSFYMVLSLSDALARERAGAPEGAVFAVKQITDITPGNHLALWRFLDTGFRMLGSRVVADDPYDPRARSWYQDALASSEVHTGAPYVFNTLQIPGITVSRRLDGAIQGVFGIDVRLDELSAFLADNLVTEDTSLAIIDESGDVLAFANAEQEGIQSASADLVSVLELGIPELAAVYGRSFVAGSRGSMEAFDAANRHWLGRVIPIEMGSGRNHQFIVAAVPLDELMGPVSRTIRIDLFISLGAVLLAVALAGLLASAIARPISDIARETGRIRKLDLDGVRPFGSTPIREVKALREAVATMRTSLLSFSRYIPKGLVQAVVDADRPPEAGGANRKITVMFTDVRGFTAVASEMAPSDVLRKLSSYFERLTEAVVLNNGVIDKFIGDALMVLWSALAPDPDHRRNACMAVLACRVAGANLNREWQSYGWPLLETRIGVHSGEATVGHVGSSDRLQFTAVGTTVNVASRLEMISDYYGTRSLLSEETVLGSGDEFVFLPVAEVLPKGVSAPIKVFDLVGTRETVAGAYSVSPEERLFVDRWTDAYRWFMDGMFERSRERLLAIRSVAESYDRLVEIYLERIARNVRDQEMEGDWRVEKFLQK